MSTAISFLRRITLQRISLVAIVMAIALVFIQGNLLIASNAATSVATSEMTNQLYSTTCQPYHSATIIDRYDTNFTVTDSNGLREWRVGFVASDSVHHYYLEAFFEEFPLSGTFEGAPAAFHIATMVLYKNGVLTENESTVAAGPSVPNRTVIEGDFVDFFVNLGYLQVFWYETNTTINNQVQIFSTNLNIPSNFEITDEYQIFTPGPGATSIKMTNFEVSVQASQISNVLPHIQLTYSEKTPKCAVESPILVDSNLCFDNPALMRDSSGKAFGISETMFSSDIDPD